MKKNWPTKDNDLHVAERFMEEYATEQESNALGLFELVVNQEEKRMNFRLANWVMALAKHFNSIYGPHQGDYITRQIISRCIVQGQTLH